MGALVVLLSCLWDSQQACCSLDSPPNCPSGLNILLALLPESQCFFFPSGWCCAGSCRGQDGVLLLLVQRLPWRMGSAGVGGLGSSGQSILILMGKRVLCERDPVPW